MVNCSQSVRQRLLHRGEFTIFCGMLAANFSKGRLAKFMSVKSNILRPVCFALVCLLAGCASAPGPVVADIPLVHTNYAAAMQGDAIIAPGVKIENGAEVVLDNQRWQVGPGYHSAANQFCHEITPSGATATFQHTGTRSLLCNNNGQWRRYSTVLQHQSSSATGL